MSEQGVNESSELTLLERTLLERVATIEEQLRGIQVATKLREDAQRQATELSERAVEIQATEYRRRLDELNHAHAQQVQAQATYIGREVYEGFVREIATWRERVNTRLDTLDGRTSGASSSQRTLVTVLTIVLAVAAVIVSVIFKA